MRINNRRWLLAIAAVSASAAFGGIGAGTASAALPGHCLGANIQGQGASFQGAAQHIWTLTGFNTASAANGGCATPTARYTPNGSGACLSGFGANGGAFNTTFAYCGTDDAPTAAQIANITTTAKASPLTIPVAQAAIAVVVNPPSGCTISTVTPGQVEQAFRGSIATWSGLSTSGTCGSPINRVARADSSGTTYQFKRYLTTQNGAVVHAGQTWGGLQSTANNTTWPGSVVKSTTNCATAMALPCGSGLPGSGGSDEVRTVGATSGSIGYAALADARSVTTALAATDPRLKWVPIRSALAAVDPSTNGLSATKARSNCTTASNAYTPQPALGATGDWSQTYLTNAANLYPICALTYDLALTKYDPHFGTATGTNIAQTVKDYLHYVVTSTGGQADALSSNNDYQALPGDVRTTATAGIAEITG